VESFPAQAGTAPHAAEVVPTRLSSLAGGAPPEPYAGPSQPATPGAQPGPPARAPRPRRRKAWWVAVALVFLLISGATLIAMVNGWPLRAFGADPLTPDDGGEPMDAYTSVADKVAATGEIVIGVKGDLPGVGLERGGGFEGFDVEVAKRLAAALGATQTEFVRVSRGDRADQLDDGTLDLVVATYSIDEVDEDRVRFAGPYYLAHQDILVHSGAGIDSIEDLEGKRVCALNSPSVGKVQDVVKVRPVTAGNYAQCMDLLRAGKVDAVPGDDLILAGFASRENLRYKIVGAKLSNERYAVGIRKGDVKTCKAINGVIADLYASGAMKQLLARHFGKVEFQMELKPPAMESCG
jgi:ABC-type amino acid transport substrate-binding protein